MKRFLHATPGFQAIGQEPLDDGVGFLPRQAFGFGLGFHLVFCFGKANPGWGNSIKRLPTKPPRRCGGL